MEQMQARERALQARAAAAAAQNANLLQNLDAFRGVHLDPNAHHWDEVWPFFALSLDNGLSERGTCCRTRTISWIPRSNSEMELSTRSPKKMLQLQQLPSPLNSKNKLYGQHRLELELDWQEKKIFENLHLRNSQDWKLL